MTLPSPIFQLGTRSSSPLRSPSLPISQFPSSSSSSSPPTLASHSLLVRNAIIGLADGLTVPFALTAGLSSLGSTRLVVLGGLAELFAGALSMGLGAFLAAATERKRYVLEEGRLRREFELFGKTGGELIHEENEEGITREEGRTRKRDMDKADEEGRTGGKGSFVEGEEEIYGIFKRFGIARGRAKTVIEGLKGNEEGWLRFRLEIGMGMEKRGRREEWEEGLTMGLAYFLGGLLPMIPYFASDSVDDAVFTSIGITAGVLLGFGYVKAWILGMSHHHAAWSAVQTLVIGAMAAGASYGIVRGVSTAHLI